MRRQGIQFTQIFQRINSRAVIIAEDQIIRVPSDCREIGQFNVWKLLSGKIQRLRRIMSLAHRTRTRGAKLIDFVIAGVTVAPYDLQNCIVIRQTQRFGKGS